MINIIYNAISLAKDLIQPATANEILHGKKLFRSSTRYQTTWLKHFYPNNLISPEKNTWHYLQQYMMPLIMKNASSYHVNGIRLLNLDVDTQPAFKLFQCQFAQISNGFTIEPVDKEIAAKEYFELIHQKRFPCIAKMREHEELFCASEPDFWHEAIGHIAPLCFKEVQEFYIAIAECILSATTMEEFHRRLAIAWTLLEYGFLKENGQDKMFGAALVGSHLANMRYEQKLIAIEPATRDAILESGFYEEDSPSPKDEHGRFRFFCLPTLSIDQLFIE